MGQLLRPGHCGWPVQWRTLMPWMQWRACMWLKLSLFGLVLCPDWLREDAGVGDRSKEVVEVCSHHRWETSLGLSYVCAHGWAETLLVIHLLGRLSPEEIWSAEDSDLKMWGADRDMIRSFHSCRSRFNPESVKQKMEGMGAVSSRWGVKNTPRCWRISRNHRPAYSYWVTR